MMKKLKSTLMLLIVSLAMVLNVAPMSVFAADADATNWEISKSKEATNLDSNYESRVTLSLPAGDYAGNLDVVFVLDGSTSTDEQNLASCASNLMKSLAEYQNLNVKVGLVIFGGSTPLLYTSDSLLDFSDESNVNKLVQEITDKSYDGKSGRSGSNLQAGVKEAQKMLNADSDVDDSDKYLLLLTDGGARMWVNDSGESMSQTYRQWNGDSISWGYNQDYASRYIEKDPQPEIRNFSEVWEAGNSNPDFAKYAMTKADTEKDGASKKAASWETVCDTTSSYYPSLEVATYYAATSIIEASKNSNVIWVDYPYHSGQYKEYTDSLKSWLASNNYITRYDSTQSQAETIFSNVKDQLTYLLDAGTTVVDYMGYVKGDYNLDFVNKSDTLTLTVDGEEKAVTQLGKNSYGFGDKLDSGKYEYELTYSPANDGEEHFQWDINVPVSKDAPLKLTYTVKLVNPKTTAGTYGVYDKYGENNDGSASYDLYTNNKATLNPVDSNGKKGTSEDFKKPTVSYVVKSTPTEDEEVSPTNFEEEESSVSESSVPDTSDSFPLEGLLLLMVVSAAGIGVVQYLRRRTH